MEGTMMKIKLLSTVIGISMLPLSLAISSEMNRTLSAEQQYFTQEYQFKYNQINDRLRELQTYAENPDNVIIINDERFIELSGIKYKLNNKNNPEIPLRAWDDASAIQTLFPFFTDDWELSQYSDGAVFVNKYFGNYNYGNGCLLEYYPDGSIQNGQITDVIIETSSCSVNSFDTNVRYFGNPIRLTPLDLNQDRFSATAVERYRDRLYVTRSVQNQNNYIDVYNIKTNEIIDRIEGSTTSSGQTYKYHRLNELYIEDNYLFVVSWESNRVDVLDLDNNHQHIMQIGIDSSTGTGLFRPQSVVGNNNYLFISDAKDKIAVIEKTQVTPENSNHMDRFASLAFGSGQYSHRLVQMHILNDYLLVNTSNNNYAIYDTRKIQPGITLQPEKVVAIAPNKIDRSGEHLIININGRLEWHKISTFIANNFEFIEPEGNIKSLNGDEINNYQDIHFDNNELITITANNININSYIVNSNITFTADQSIEVTPVQFNQLMPSAIQKIYTNNDTLDILTNAELRSVRINKLINTKFIDNSTVEITNYNAKTVTNIDIFAKLNGIDKWFILGNIDTLPPFTRITLPLSAFGEVGRYNSSNNDGVFDLSTIMSRDDNFTDLLQTSFNSKTDKFVQKIKKIKPRWNIRTTGASTGNWLPMSPLHAREYLIMMTNFAYMASSEEYKLFWFNFSEMYGDGTEFYGNAGPVEGPNGFFTPNDYDHYYDAMLNRDYLSLGVVQNVGGLGSPSITGISENNFYLHYYGYYGILAHEFGHGFDGKHLYNDGTAFAASWFGFQPMMTDLGMYLIRKGDMPYLDVDEDLNGFYKDENAQYRHFPVTAKRAHRPDSNSNKFDKWFMASSTMPQGWFANTDSFKYEQLNNHEKASIAKLNKDGLQLPICRFTQEIEGYPKTLYGYVNEITPDTYECTLGSEISYRLSDGTHFTPVSALNQFDWLSLHSPNSSGQLVESDQGLPLCTINSSGFYGVGFKINSACQQIPEIYWSNGNRWFFSSGHSTYQYR